MDSLRAEMADIVTLYGSRTDHIHTAYILVPPGHVGSRNTEHTGYNHTGGD